MPVQLSVAADGRPVAEADLRVVEDVDAVVREARRVGAAVLWAYGDELGRNGFVPEGGYALLVAERGVTAPGRAAAAVRETRDAGELVELFRAGYAGLWGHKRPDPGRLGDLAGRPSVVHLVTAAGGVCRLDLEQRLVDGPGLPVRARAPEAYAALALAAAARLGEGRAALESWGDAPEVLAAYEELGFEPRERLQGWTLDL